jgi:SAM-dependent methyltransferase
LEQDREMLSNTKVLTKSVLDTVKRSRPIYNVGRKVRFALGDSLGARPVEGISGRVHYNDFMLNSTAPADVKYYLHGANEFVDILERSCKEAGRDPQSVADVLEVGCGYGRIVRELRKRMPWARVTVSDVIESAARFTASEFGAQYMPPLEEAGAEYDGRFDLVYLLSVYSHLRRDMVAANLRRVSAVLKPGGVAVITLQGQGSAETVERYGFYWLNKNELLQAMAHDGYHYEKYPYYYADYGVTWFTQPAFDRLVRETTPELTAISFRPMDIDGHQDTLVYRKDK